MGLEWGSMWVSGWGWFGLGGWFVSVATFWLLDGLGGGEGERVGGVGRVI